MTGALAATAVSTTCTSQASGSMTSMRASGAVTDALGNARTSAARSLAELVGSEVRSVRREGPEALPGAQQQRETGAAANRRASNFPPAGAGASVVVRLLLPLPPLAVVLVGGI